MIPVPTLDELKRKSEEDFCQGDDICVKIVALAELPTRFGDFQVVAFESNDGKEHIALVHGDPCTKSDIPVRLHSECLTGDALGSYRCDCRDQLQASLKTAASQDAAVVLYLRQEGRGIGLLNKLKAYQLQDSGLDTVEANEALGFRDDEREYAVAAKMIQALRIKSVHLMTNNPRKIDELTTHGISVTGRISVQIPPNPHNIKYLKTKRDKSGHLLDDLRVSDEDND